MSRFVQGEEVSEVAVMLTQNNDVVCEVDYMVDDVTAATLCEKIVSLSEASALGVTCPYCQGKKAGPDPLSPPQKVQRRRKMRVSYGRTTKKRTEEAMGESLNFAHKEIRSAIEWHNRGVPGQFREEALDRINLACRFLHEILLSNDRDLPDPDAAEEDDE